MRYKYKIIKVKLCDMCGCDLHERDGFPFFSQNNLNYCLKCAYESQLISKKKYYEMNGVHI